MLMTLRDSQKKNRKDAKNAKVSQRFFKEYSIGSFFLWICFISFFPNFLWEFLDDSLLSGVYGFTMLSKAPFCLSRCC